MERLYIIDNYRGIAFILMTIQHIFYYWNISKSDENIELNSIASLSGTISRYLFIILAGYSMNMSYKKTVNKKEWIKKKINRIFEILIHALLITLITYIFYPQKFIRFGILHFIGLASLMSIFIVPYKNLTILLLFLSIFIKYPIINNFMDTITGASTNYDMLDRFSLKKFLPFFIFGIILSQHYESYLETNKIEALNKKIPYITEIGKNTLNLYTIQIILFVILFKTINK